MSRHQDDPNTETAAENGVIPTCVRAWEAIYKFLKSLTSQEINQHPKDADGAMYDILDEIFSRRQNCPDCALFSYLKYAQSEKKLGVDMLGVNMDYLRDPYLVQADTSCGLRLDKKVPAVASEETIVSNVDAAGSLRRRIIEPEIDEFEDLGDHPVTFRRVAQAIHRGIHADG